MTEKSFYFSKKKHIPKVLIANAIFLACLSVVIFSLSAGSLHRIGILILVGIIGILAALYVIASIPVLFSKAAKEITLNSEGIFSSGNHGKDIGLVPWQHITRIVKNTISGKSYICVYVDDVSPFLINAKNKESRNALKNNQIALMIDNEDVAEPMKEILAACEEFFEEYGNTTSREVPEGEAKTSPAESLKIPVLGSKVFMHYDSGTAKQKNFEDQGWLNQYVFFWDAHEAFERKSLPAEFENLTHRYFILTKQLPKQISIGAGKVMPWFGMPGNGDKFFLSSNNKHMPIKMLMDTGHFTRIELLD